MKDKLELDPRILEKNLEITKILADNTTLRSELVDLKERMKSPIMLSTLKECHDIFIQWELESHKKGEDTQSSEGLRKEIRKVISFLQQ